MCIFAAMQNTVISEGRSNAYLLHGIGVLLVMGALTLWSPFALILFPLAVVLFIADSGVEIDSKQLRVRRYIGFSRFRRGIWIPLKHFSGAELKETLVLNQSKSFFRYQRSTSRTFDVLLTMPDGEKFEINDFFEYGQAVACGEAIARLINVKLRNHYAEKTAELRRRPRRR